MLCRITNSDSRRKKQIKAGRTPRLYPEDKGVAMNKDFARVLAIIVMIMTVAYVSGCSSSSGGSKATSCTSNTQCSSGQICQSGSCVNTTTSIPSAPINLTATAGNAQVTLIWSASSGAASYNIYDSTTSNGSYTKITSTTNTTYTAIGLTNDVTYYFVVTAVNSSGESGYSNQAIAYPTGKPSYPTNLSAAAGNAQVTLKWNPSKTYAVGDQPWNVTVDKSGNVWVANYLSDTVTKLDSNGITIGTYNVENGTGYYNYHSGASNMVVDSSGNVWVTNWDNCNVTELSSTGSILGLFVDGTYCDLYGIAIDASGNIWVSSQSNNLVFEMNSSGTIINSYPVGNSPYGLAIDSFGNIWVANNGDNTVTKLSPTGSTVGTYPVGSYPYNIAIDTSNNVWVTNNGGNTVTELGPNGSVLGTYVVGSAPQGIAIDGSGNVWETNSADGTVTELSPTGSTLGTYGTGGYPVGIAIDNVGNLWITNIGSNTVTRLRSNPARYNIYESTTQGGPYTKIGTTYDTSFTASSLTIGTKYYFVITEVNSAGESGYSMEVSAIPVQNYTYAVGSGPQGIAIDAAGHIWVTNINDNTVTQLDANGISVGTFTTGVSPWAIAIDKAGNIWIADDSNGYGPNLTELNPTGTTIDSITLVANAPNSIAIDSSGNLWIAEPFGAIDELTSTGVTIGTYNLNQGNYCLAIDNSNNVWVSNWRIYQI